MRHPDALPGRGAPENRTPTRFNLKVRETDDDWRDAQEEIDGRPPPLHTTVTIEHPKTIITRNASPDIGFDRSINAYRGCEHGCIYCFARPGHAFHDLSPGLDFESKLFAKPDAAKLLRAELGKLGYVPRPIAMGTNTDPYQPIEAGQRDHLLVHRSAARNPPPVDHHHQVQSRGARHRPAEADGAIFGLVSVAVSVTSLDTGDRPDLRAAMRAGAAQTAGGGQLCAERGRVSPPSSRSRRWCPASPTNTKWRWPRLVEAAAEAGARAPSTSPVRLPWKWHRYFAPGSMNIIPTAPQKVMNIIQYCSAAAATTIPISCSRMRGARAVGRPSSGGPRHRPQPCSGTGLNQERTKLRL